MFEGFSTERIAVGDAEINVLPQEVARLSYYCMGIHRRT
jgi:hypothetical protein